MSGSANDYVEFFFADQQTLQMIWGSLLNKAVACDHTFKETSNKPLTLKSHLGMILEPTTVIHRVDVLC